MGKMFVLMWHLTKKKKNAEKLLPKFLSPEIKISEYVEIAKYLDTKTLRQDYWVNTLSKFIPLLGFVESKKEKKKNLDTTSVCY